MGFLAVYGKTLADLSRPKVLVGYYVPFLVVTGMMALGMASNEFEGASTVAQQEAVLSGTFTILSFFLGVGFPFLALVAVLSANTLAREAELGTLRILLSKPIRRWEILLATFAAVVTFSGLVAVANLLLCAVMLFAWSGAGAAAISGGLFAWLPGHVAYALFGAAVLTAVGLALGVQTGDRLKTTLGAFAVPALYFAFLPIRLFSGALYEEYALYLVDVNYHFGNAYVFIHEAVGSGFGAEAQGRLAVLTGVYALPEEEPDQLPESLELTGYVPMELSVLGLALVGAGALGLAVYRFRNLDA